MSKNWTLKTPSHNPLSIILEHCVVRRLFFASIALSSTAFTAFKKTISLRYWVPSLVKSDPEDKYKGSGLFPFLNSAEFLELINLCWPLELFAKALGLSLDKMLKYKVKSDVAIGVTPGSSTETTTSYKPGEASLV